MEFMLGKMPELALSIHLDRTLERWQQGVDVILPPTQCSQDCETTRQFEVELDWDFITDSRNGDITHSGIIVAQDKDGGKFVIIFGR